MYYCVSIQMSGTCSFRRSTCTIHTILASDSVDLCRNKAESCLYYTYSQEYREAHHVDQPPQATIGQPTLSSCVQNDPTGKIGWVLEKEMRLSAKVHHGKRGSVYNINIYVHSRKYREMQSAVLLFHTTFSTYVYHTHDSYYFFTLFFPV